VSIITIKFSVSVPENFLDDLYHGNVNLGVNSYEGYDKEHMSRVIAAQDALQEKLSPEQWRLFLEYNALSGECAAKEACRMFKNGFRQAVRLIMAGLSREGGEKREDRI